MRYFLVILFVISSFNLLSQDMKEPYFFHDISFDYGLFASLNSDVHENYVGEKYSFLTTYYYASKFGIRSGLTYINGLEGTSKFYEIPIHFVYRTPVNKGFYIGGTIDSIDELIFKLILGLIPRQGDFYAGINLGYIEPDNYLGLSSINGIDWVKEGFQTEQRFITTLDAGVRLKYKIWRFSIIGVPYVSYVLTENFKYYSETGLDNGYKPKWFMNVSIGLSFEF